MIRWIFGDEYLTNRLTFCFSCLTRANVISCFLNQSWIKLEIKLQINFIKKNFINKGIWTLSNMQKQYSNIIHQKLLNHIRGDDEGEAREEERLMEEGEISPPAGISWRTARIRLMLMDLADRKLWSLFIVIDLEKTLEDLHRVWLRENTRRCRQNKIYKSLNQSENAHFHQHTFQASFH